jgi:hypothetical protein
MPISVAVEPRPPFRIAVGPEGGDVVIFTDTINASSIIGHAFGHARGSVQAKQLVWVGHGGESSLFARTDEGILLRMQVEGWDAVDLPPVRAIAGDAAGNFGALTVVDGTPRVYISTDGGSHLHFRSLGVDVEAAPDEPAFLALAGMAVAVGVGDSGLLVSRAAGAPTTVHPELGRAYCASFHGTDPRAWIYVGLQRRGERPAEVWLLDVDGHGSKVLDFLADDDQPLDLGPISWDDVRKALMISSRGGLIALGPEVVAPRRRATRKTKPSVQ